MPSGGTLEYLYLDISDILLSLQFPREYLLYISTSYLQLHVLYKCAVFCSWMLLIVSRLHINILVFVQVVIICKFLILLQKSLVLQYGVKWMHYGSRKFHGYIWLVCCTWPNTKITKKIDAKTYFQIKHHVHYLYILSPIILFVMTSFTILLSAISLRFR